MPVVSLLFAVVPFRFDGPDNVTTLHSKRMQTIAKKTSICVLGLKAIYHLLRCGKLNRRMLLFRTDLGQDGDSQIIKEDRYAL